MKLKSQNQINIFEAKKKVKKIDKYKCNKINHNENDVKDERESAGGQTINTLRVHLSVLLDPVMKV